MDSPAQEGSSNEAERRKIQSSSPRQRQCILVLGMHRSGTSALTRVLSLLGAALPKNLMGAGPGNETGHWEPLRLVEYHENLLIELGSTWDDWGAVHLSRLTAKRREEIKAEIGAIVEAEYGDAPLFVVKDPRICRFAPLFMQALEDRGIGSRAVIAFRNPLEVAGSLSARAALWSTDRSLIYGALLWLRHVLDAEAATRNIPRAFVSYDNLMRDWRQLITRVVERLETNWPYTLDDITDAATRFLAPTHRHHLRSAEELLLDPALRHWVADTYGALDILQRNPSNIAATAALDQVRREFERAAPLLQRLISDANATLKKAREDARTREVELSSQTDQLMRKLAESERQREEALAAQRADADAALKEVRAQAESCAAKIARLTSEVDTRTAETSVLQSQLSLMEQRSTGSELRANSLQNELNIIYSSRSWRLTAFLRTAKHHLGLRLSPFSRHFRLRQLIRAAPSTNHASTAGTPAQAQTTSNADLIRLSGLFDITWYQNQLSEDAEWELNPIEHYLAIGAKQGLDPSRQFSTTGYLAKYTDIAGTNINPLVHYIKYGSQEGRSPNPFNTGMMGGIPGVTRYKFAEYGPVSKILRYNEATPPPQIFESICVHLHLYHTGMADQFSTILRRLSIPFTLLVSVREGETETEWARFWEARVPTASRVIVKSIPNRGRDVAPWICEFASEIRAHDIFCHVHTKQSSYSGAHAEWFPFLAHTMFGSANTVNQILDAFRSNRRLGLVFPPYAPFLRRQPNFGQTKPIFLRLLADMRASWDDRPCPDFPAGSFFWCRTSILEPLYSIGLSLDDFDVEAGQLCGTLGHAIERVIGALPQITDFESECVTVDISHEVVPHIPIDLSNSYLRRSLPRLDASASEADIPQHLLTHAQSIVANAPITISVVLPTWNRREQVITALRSALAQSYRPSEIILVDDGSTDSTTDLVRATFKDEVSSGLVKIIESDHRGVAAARNLALAAAHGELVAYLDSDNKWRSHYLLIMAAIFAENLHLKCAYCALQHHDADEGTVRIVGQEYDRPQLLSDNYIDLNIFVHRNSARQSGDVFDEALSRLVDWDFILRITRTSAPSYIPFIGADYFLDKERLNNITRRIPLDANKSHLRAKHREEAIRFGADQIRIAIKCPVPHPDEAHFWGDFHFASALRLALERQGFTVRIDLMPEWYADRDITDDVVIVLRGLSRYQPDQRSFNIIWHISHPDKVDIDEYNLYDHVFIASISHASRVAEKIQVPASDLLQCSDPNIFQLPSEESTAPFTDVLFVGNSRRQQRWVPEVCVEAGIPISVYGREWEGLLPTAVIKGEHIPNNKLNEYYGRSKIVLNDHWPDMAANGFISNRIFDAALSGGFIISDQFIGSGIFGGNIITCATKEELQQAVLYWRDKPQERERIVKRLRKIVEGSHTFDHRARKIAEVINSEVSFGSQCRRAG